MPDHRHAELCEKLSEMTHENDGYHGMFEVLRNPEGPEARTAIDELHAEIARLREANGILEDALQEVGDDYPGSSCQEWCVQQVKAARKVLENDRG